MRKLVQVLAQVWVPPQHADIRVLTHRQMPSTAFNALDGILSKLGFDGSGLGGDEGSTGHRRVSRDTRPARMTN